MTYSAVSVNESVVTVNVSSNTLTVTEAGIGSSNITVTADDGNGGTVDDEFSFIVSEGSDINSLVDKIKINIYPNLADENVYIDFRANNENDIRIEILDIRGMKVYSDKLIIPSGKSVHSINMSEFAKGVYFIKFYNNQFVKVEKMILK